MFKTNVFSYGVLLWAFLRPPYPSYFSSEVDKCTVSSQIWLTYIKPSSSSIEAPFPRLKVNVSPAPTPFQWENFRGTECLQLSSDSSPNFQALSWPLHLLLHVGIGSQLRVTKPVCNYLLYKTSMVVSHLTLECVVYCWDLSQK